MTPLPVTDLTARQQGDAVVLSFTLPSTSTDQDPLAMPPSVEIYAGSLAPGAALPKKPDTRLVNTIPGDLTKNYLVAGRFQFAAPFDAGEVARSAGEQEIFQVRTRAFKGGPSGLSSVLVLRAYPPPAAIQDLRAAVTEPAIVLSWTQPDRTSTGGALPGAPPFACTAPKCPVPAAPSAGAPAAAPAAASSARKIRLRRILRCCCSYWRRRPPRHPPLRRPPRHPRRKANIATPSSRSATSISTACAP